MGGRRRWPRWPTGSPRATSSRDGERGDVHARGEAAGDWNRGGAASPASCSSAGHGWRRMAVAGRSGTTQGDGGREREQGDAGTVGRGCRARWHGRTRAAPWGYGLQRARATAGERGGEAVPHLWCRESAACSRRRTRRRRRLWAAPAKQWRDEAATVCSGGVEARRRPWHRREGGGSSPAGGSSIAAGSSGDVGPEHDTLRSQGGGGAQGSVGQAPARH